VEPRTRGNLGRNQWAVRAPLRYGGVRPIDSAAKLLAQAAAGNLSVDGYAALAAALAGEEDEGR